MLIQFLIIDKQIATLNKGNKEVLETNARQIIFVGIKQIVSDKSYDIISRIVKKIGKIQSNEVLLRKIVRHNTTTPKVLMPSEIAEIEDNLLHLESQITNDMKMDDVISKISNIEGFKPELN